MRKLAIVMALASTAIAGPALARDKAWYIGVEGGAAIVEDIKFTIAGVPDAATAKQKKAYDVDGIIGYDFGMFRLEAEVAYKESRADTYTNSVTTFRATGIAPAPAGTGAYSGKTNALSFMINGLLDFGDEDGLQGFVGGGAGVARVKFSNYSINPGGSFLNDSNTVFAYQALAGVRAPLSDHIDVGLKYRFFNADRVDVVDALGRAERGRFRSHSILGSLTKVAERRGWPISRYGSRGTSAVTNAARFAVGFGALGPITALGTARAAMTGRKWDGLNVLTSTWPKFLLDSHGVSLTILGAANAEAQRPAVFIFNHRNQMDAFMAAAVVKHDFTAVAKKELKTNPLFGTFGRLMDIAFIDRADSAKAVNAMHEVEKLAAQGLSIIVAPEGTRLDTHEVGPFKKGAFVMAMSAGIPIVPIVIRNADDIAGRDSLTVQRGVIDIAVLPPIDVSAWTRAELTERIDEVRAAYLDLLADWPTDDSDPRLTGG